MSDPKDTLGQWEEQLQAEHEAAIANLDPGEDHHVEGVTQVSTPASTGTTPNGTHSKGFVRRKSTDRPTRNVGRAPVASAG
jgi:hypothetical protein